MNDCKPSPRIGLALGSGASRGWSHIGVLKGLLREGVEPDVVCGTSVGAIIGAAYLAGNLAKLEEWVLGSSRADVLRFFSIGFSRSGFVDIERMKWFLHSFVADEQRRIESLPATFAAVATNLENGREVWLSSGEIAEAVRASMAMPGLFPAVNIDDQWLVDGGLVNPVPVSACRAFDADVIIAVNLNTGIVGRRLNPARRTPEPENDSLLSSLRRQARTVSSSWFPENNGQSGSPSVFFAISSSIDIFQDRITRSRLAGDPADVSLSPKLADIGMLEFHRAADAIAEGERCVTNALPEIRRALGSQVPACSGRDRPS